MASGRPSIGAGQIEQPSFAGSPKPGIDISRWRTEVVNINQVKKIAVLIAVKTNCSGILMGNADPSPREGRQVLLDKPMEIQD